MNDMKKLILGDCDCDKQNPSDEYLCDRCDVRIVICSDCYIIIDGCGCGNCDEGAGLHESD